MEFLYGALACWAVIGALSWLGLTRNWHESERFWIALCLPIVPVIWLWSRFQDWLH